MAIANQTPANVASQYATTQFIVQQLMLGMATAALVRVMKCTNIGGLERSGTVDVRILVDMVTEDGQTFPHGTIFKAPYQRLQGGANAVIIDPEPGDIGVCVFAMRDSSAVKSDPDAARNRSPNPGAPPGSRRTFSLSDALYVGGMLNGVPTQFIRFSTDGITITSPSAVTISAPTIRLEGTVTQTGGTISSDTDVLSAGISGKTHVHSDPQGGDVGPPI